MAGQGISGDHKDESIDSDDYVDGSVDTIHLADNAVTLAKMASGTDGNIISFDTSGNPVAIATGNDGQILTSGGAGAAPAFAAPAALGANSVDSDNYVDGSIDTIHLADNAVTLAKMASGTDGNIISFDASGNPVAIATGNDGQVLTSAGAGAPPAFEDAGALGANSIDSDNYVDGSIDPEHLADNAVTLAKMASGTDGNIISYDASGNPVAIATGNSGQILTSAGAGAQPSFSAPAALSADSVDSDNYVDGSIDAAHFSLAGLQAPHQLDATPPADHTATGPQTATLNAGYACAAFDLVYLGSSSTWLEADSDATATSINMLGVTLAAADSGAAVNVALPGSFIRDDTFNFTPGLALYVSGTLGAMTHTKPTGSGDIVRTVGYALNADVVFFQPSSDYVVLA